MLEHGKVESVSQKDFSSKLDFIGFLSPLSCGRITWRLYRSVWYVLLWPKKMLSSVNSLVWSRNDLYFLSLVMFNFTTPVILCVPLGDSFGSPNELLFKTSLSPTIFCQVLKCCSERVLNGRRIFDVAFFSDKDRLFFRWKWFDISFELGIIRSRSTFSFVFFSRSKNNRDDSDQ